MSQVLTWRLTRNILLDMCHKAFRLIALDAHVQFALTNIQGTVRVHLMNLPELMAHNLSKQQHVLLQPPVR
jgi:hypothetical protein